MHTDNALNDALNAYELHMNLNTIFYIQAQHRQALIQVHTLKSNFAQVEAFFFFFYFPTKAAPCMNNFKKEKSKTDKSNFG